MGVSYVGANDYRVRVKTTGTGAAQFAFWVVDSSGTIISTPTSDDQVIVSNMGTVNNPLNATYWILNNSYTGNKILQGGNFWISGVFELFIKSSKIGGSILTEWQHGGSVTLRHSTDTNFASGTAIYTGTDTQFLHNTPSTGVNYYSLFDNSNILISYFKIFA
jgi:hypothetical protein